VYWQGSLTSSYCVSYEYEPFLYNIYKEKREGDSTHQNDRGV